MRSSSQDYVVEASIADGTSFTESCSSAAPPTTGATGTLTGAVDASAIVGAGAVQIIALNSQNETGTWLGGSNPALSGSFNFAAPAGTDRVMALAWATVNDPTAGQLITSLVAARNFSSQSVPGALNGGAGVVLGAADQTTTEPIVYQNVPPGYSAPTTQVSYQIGTVGAIPIASAATTSYPALPNGAAESEDYYSFVIGAHASTPSYGTTIRTTRASAGPQSINFPPAWSPTGPDLSSTQPSFDFSYSGFSGSTDVFYEATLGWVANATTTENEARLTSPHRPTPYTYILPDTLISIIATKNYLNGSTTVRVPDLSGLTGFLTLPSGANYVYWNAAIAQGSSQLIQSSPISGTVTTVFAGPI